MPYSRTLHSKLSSEEIADRLAIRELVDAYAHCPDRRDVDSQLSLFTADTEFIDSRNADAPQTVKGREGLRPLFEGLKAFETTTHFNGQSTVELGHNSASGLLNCLVYLVQVDGPDRSLTISSGRYLDQFVKLNGVWCFKQRKAIQDWMETRRLTSSWERRDPQ